MLKQSFLISHTITSSYSNSMRIIFTNLETKEVFTSEFNQISLIPWFINVFTAVRDYGRADFYLYDHLNQNTRIYIYKNYIALSPSFEMLVKKLLWEHLFKGTIHQTNPSIDMEIPNLLQGL